MINQYGIKDGMFQGPYKDYENRKEFQVDFKICKTCPKCVRYEFWSQGSQPQGYAYRCCVSPLSSFDVAEKLQGRDEVRNVYSKTPLNCVLYFEYFMFYDGKTK